MLRRNLLEWFDYVRTGVFAYQFSAGIQNFQRHGSGGILRKKIIDDRAIRWILSRRYFRWQGSVWISVPSHTHCFLRSVQMRARLRDFIFQLSQRRNVIENPE